jgi:tetratricopeptide (TPR) repeat protein
MAMGATFGILGALSAFPRRLAAREVARQGHALRGAAAHDISHMVFGRKLLDRTSPEDIAKRFDAARKAGAVVLSENGFRRKLGLIKRPSDAGVSRASLAEQSKLDGRSLDLLSLFDAFEADAEPYSFRDVILARKYAKLIIAGTSWADIARSVHRTGNVASLTAMALHSEGGDIFVRDGERLSEIDGQGLLPFEQDESHEGADELFTEAEAAEASGDHAAAAALYGQYLAVVPGDPVAAFNRANALAASGARDDAAAAYARTLKIDPGFAEAWFNFGSLLRDTGKPDLARRHFEKAIALNASYADPIYSLAALEYDTGQLHEARRLWARYLELDSSTDWAKKAARGIQLIDMTLNAERKHGA